MMPLAAGLLIVVCATQASADAAHGKRHDVIKAMQENGCKMPAHQTQATMAEFMIEPDVAVTQIGKLIAEGSVVFDTDDKTLLLLPRECKA